MLTESARIRRVPAQSMVFSDVRDGVKGFAEGWFFWVHEAFKRALDIRFVERVDPVKTREIREKKSLALCGMPLSELKLRAKDDQTLSEQKAYIMRYKRKFIIETEGDPPLLNFRETDSMESRCGRWYLSVTQARADEYADRKAGTFVNAGSVGFTIFERSVDRSAIWQSHSWRTLTQREFAELLRFGRGGDVSLRDKA